MKSYKYSKTEVHQVLVKVLRNAAGKKTKNKQTNKQTKKMKKAKLQAVVMMRKT